VPTLGPGSGGLSSVAAGGVFMDRSAHDILLVGGQTAGLRGAIAAAELNPTLSIAVQKQLSLIMRLLPSSDARSGAKGGMSFRNA